MRYCLLILLALFNFVQKDILENPEITFLEIRQNKALGFTSTILSTPMAKKFIEPEKGGFYGMYYGYEIEETKDPVKYTLVIWDNKKPWMSENKTQRLLEVRCRGLKVKIFKTIGVGTSVKDLENKLGKPQIEIKDFKIYTSKTYSYSFQIKDEKIIAFRFGLYKDQITSKNIPTYLYEFYDK